MPTYSYACTECGHRFEAVQAFTDDSLTVCPVCSGTLRKVFSSVGIVFKGSGFYRTDSRAGAVSQGATASEKGSEGKGSDSKGSDGKGSDGKSSDGKGSEKAAPATTGAAGGKDKASAPAGKSSSGPTTTGA